jgi:hypothetical protein
MKRIRRYSELRDLTSIYDRYDYLKLTGVVGKATFGFDRYLNQVFYRSPEWKRIRNIVIVRDNGCDLGIEGFEIHDRILVHHMNPINVRDISQRNRDVLNPEFLICTSLMTHQAIHYGDESLLPQVPIERRPGDTRLW